MNKKMKLILIVLTIVACLSLVLLASTLLDDLWNEKNTHFGRNRGIFSF